ncbi:MAG: hypothetical protein ACREEV_10800, partial [Dongiaceae bacterium]
MTTRIRVHICTIVAALALFLCSGAVLAQGTTQPADVPPKVRELLDLLSDPAVRDWLSQQQAAKTAAAPAPAGPEMTPSGHLASRLA